MAPRRFFVGGNFKMNGDTALINTIVSDLAVSSNTETVICPSFIHLPLALDLIQKSGKDVAVAAQNAYFEEKGAFTGEVSIPQLIDLGVKWVLLGHSERRSIFKETDDLIARKVKSALQSNISVIFCVGETLEEREANQATEVVNRQLQAVQTILPSELWSRIVIAYEPVWAIGTGKVATPEQAEEIHAHIREWVSSNVSSSTASTIRIIYGGSVAAKNAKELSTKENIDGFLVGGASLKPEFSQIVNV